MSSAIAHIARTGIKAKHCLEIWGYIRSFGRSEPEGWGYPGATIEARLMSQGAGAREPGRSPELTGPEMSVDGLARDENIAIWVDSILADMPMQVRVMAHLHWRAGKRWKEIAEQMSKTEETTPEDVERYYMRVMDHVKRGLKKLRSADAELTV